MPSMLEGKEQGSTAPWLSVRPLVGWLALALGLGATLWGLTHSAWTGTSIRHLPFVVGCAVAVALGARYSRLHPMVVSSALAVLIALLAGALWSLVATLWFAVASALFGWSILSKLGIKRGGNTRLADFLVGAGTYGTLVGLLAHFPVSYPGVYSMALAVPVILAWRRLAEAAAATRGLVTMSSSPEPLAVAISAVALLHFVVALMPEVGDDALAMHLFVPAHVAQRHQWSFDAGTYVWAVMPMLGDWIFSIGYMLAGESAARLTNVGFIFVLGWLVRCLVLWGGGTERGAKWAVLLFLTTPLTFTESTSLFIESVWASFTVAGILAVLHSCSSDADPPTDLPLAGILLGFALATKAVTFAVLPPLVVLFAYRYKLWLGFASAGSLLGAFGLLTILGVIPYATAWWQTGNPVFPFFNGLFRSPFYPPVDFDSSTIFGKGLTWDFLYKVTFDTGKYLESNPGAAGFQWLLLWLPCSLMLALPWQRRSLALILVGVACTASVFQSVSYLRYVFPMVAIGCAVIGLGLAGNDGKASPLQIHLAITCFLALALNLLFINAATFYSDFSLKSIFVGNSRETYLMHRLPIRKAVELVNQLNGGNQPVAVFSAPLTAGLAADALYPSWYNRRFMSSIATAKTPDGLAGGLHQAGVRLVILDQNWGSQEQRKLVEQVTEAIAEFGPISVRNLRASIPPAPGS